MENAAPNSPYDAEQPSISDPGWTLRRRLLVIITIALLPVVGVSIFQGVERVKRDTEDVRAQLIQSARATAANQQEVLNAGEQILRAMGSLQDVRDMSGNCDGILADAMIGVSYFTNLSRIDANGTFVCSAVPLAKGINIGKLPVFDRIKAAKGVVVGTRTISQASGRPVVGTQLPLLKADGSFDGSLAIVLDAQWFGYLLRAHPLPKGAVAVVYDRNGAILATNDATVAPAIAAAAMKAGFPDGASLDAYQAGRAWRFGNTALMGDTLFVAFAEQEDRLFGQTYVHVGIDFLLPIAMILFAWIAIWFATDRQVTQWIFYLRRIAIAYRSGHYTIRPDLADAPTEFKQLGEAMSEMAGGIQDRDRRLREAVNLKTTLIREIHHRVKNNLQIVMSLLSIQANQVKDPHARDALMQAQTRINALALVHRILNELEDQSTLDLKQLLDELSRQIAEGMGDTEHVRVEVDVPHMVVNSGIAVALALFTVEALTNIFKHAYPLQRRGVITVGLAPDGPGKLKLSIADDGIGFAMDETGKSVGSRLIRTFGAQLGGVSSVHSEAGRGTVVELVFPDPGLKERAARAGVVEKAPAPAGG
ncbi:MAG: sensor histidine kinase [Alphaproteobacteria bacterium]|nr:sensor histidine kinase [Alphaproteobacteria bacterium]